MIVCMYSIQISLAFLFSFQNADAAFRDATLISFFPAYIPRAIFDVSFFAIVTTVGLGVIFGIIIDTFSELRDEKVSTVQLHRASYTVHAITVSNRIISNAIVHKCTVYVIGNNLRHAYIISLGLLCSFVRLVLISQNGSYA